MFQEVKYSCLQQYTQLWFQRAALTSQKLRQSFMRRGSKTLLAQMDVRRREGVKRTRSAAFFRNSRVVAQTATAGQSKSSTISPERHH